MFEKTEKNEQFNPTWRGMWFNENFIIRRIISEEIQKNSFYLSGKIMDYGCGSRPYEVFFPDSQYVGVDVSISGHPQKDKKADVYFDGETLPFEDCYFDGILASEVLEHVMDLKKCLSELHRVIKPGGRILITCPFVWPIHEEPYDFARYTPYALAQEFEKSGFTIIKTDQCGSPAEVLGQIFIIEILPVLLRPFAINVRIYRWIRRFLMGMIVCISRLGFRNKSHTKKLYLTNLVVAEKLN